MNLADDDIVVLVQHNGQYSWYVSDRGNWVLDWDAWLSAFVSAGYGTNDPHHSARFGLAVVDFDNAAEFLDHMRPFRKEPEALRDARTVDGDPALPALFVDFDERRIVVSGVVESPAFEDFMPPGWTSSFGSIIDRVPSGIQYWPRST